MASSSTLSRSKHVAFADQASSLAPEDSADSASEDEFCEITTSKAEPLSTSGEEDAELLKVALDGAYTRNPSFFSKCALDLAERSSLLLLDKDFLDSECTYMYRLANNITSVDAKHHGASLSEW